MTARSGLGASVGAAKSLGAIFGPERPVEVRRLAPNGRRTEVALSGSTAAGQIVLLLHAIGLDWRVWFGVMAWLPDDVLAVAVDLAGFGAAADSLPTSMSDHAADLAAVLDELGIERVNAVGLSYGGAVAQTLALEHRGRVASLGLVATLSRAPAGVFEERARTAEEGGLDSYVEATIERWFTEDERRHRGAPVRYVEARLRCTPVPTWAQAWRVLGRVDVLDRLESLCLPATVVAGELDTACPPASMRTIADRLDGSSYSVLPGASHMLPLEEPFTLARLIYRGLQ